MGIETRFLVMPDKTGVFLRTTDGLLSVAACYLGVEPEWMLVEDPDAATKLLCGIGTEVATEDELWVLVGDSYVAPPEPSHDEALGFVTLSALRAERYDDGDPIDRMDAQYAGFSVDVDADSLTDGLSRDGRFLPASRSTWENIAIEDQRAGVHNGW